jgi:hypothetical protein
MRTIGGAGRVLIARLLTGLRRTPRIAIDETRLRHIFRIADGHFPIDSAANRRLLLGVAENPADRLGKDRFRTVWAVQETPSGSHLGSEPRGSHNQWRHQSATANFQLRNRAIRGDETRDMIVRNQVLSLEQSFQAMSRFLEQYSQRVGGKSELAAVLSDIQVMPDGRPADRAAWGDWLGAVRIVLEDTPP